MRTKQIGGYTLVWLSATDTYNWAHRPDAAWPCSFLAGRRLMAEFHADNLIDLSIDSGRGDQDCPSDEFNAIIHDFTGIGVVSECDCPFCREAAAEESK